MEWGLTVKAGSWLGWVLGCVWGSLCLGAHSWWPGPALPRIALGKARGGQAPRPGSDSGRRSAVLGREVGGPRGQRVQGGLSTGKPFLTTADLPKRGAYHLRGVRGGEMSPLRFLRLVGGGGESGLRSSMLSHEV